MKLLSRNLLFFVYLVVSFLYTFFAQANPQTTCSVTKPCPDNYACIGAVGTGEGVCTMTGPQIVLCKTVKYFDKNLAGYFAIFAIVMIGIAFFLGKISWGMIVSVIFGIGMIKGATTIIKHISDQSDGFCADTIEDYTTALDPNCITDDPSTQRNTTKIYNIEVVQGNTYCQSPIACTQKTCTFSDSSASSGTLFLIYNNTHNSVVVQPNQVMYLPKNLTTIEVTKCSRNDFFDTTKICARFSGACTDVTQTPPQDYFLCKNTCLNTSFAKKYNAGSYADCKAIYAKSATA